MNIAVIGCGYWGNHIIRNLYNSDEWDLKYICDIDESNLKETSKKFPHINAVDNFDEILLDDSIAAIAIATPVSTHYDLAKKSLNAGKHTWVEKPLTEKSDQAEELVDLAEKKGVLLHVDHTYIYTPAVRKIREIIDSGSIGDILYFDSVRINLGLFQHDVNVVWDLAPHDISILEYTSNKRPVSVNASGKSLIEYSERGLENIAYVTINFDDNTLAHVHVNWLSPVKIRHIIFGGSSKMLVFNDMEPMQKIKVYDSGVSMKTREQVYNSLINYRVGDMYSPAIDNYEALANECNHFKKCIEEGRKTDTPGESGLYVVKILEAADKSLKNNGKSIEI